MKSRVGSFKTWVLQGWNQGPGDCYGVHVERPQDKVVTGNRPQFERTRVVEPPQELEVSLVQRLEVRSDAKSLPGPSSQSVGVVKFWTGVGWGPWEGGGSGSHWVGTVRYRGVNAAPERRLSVGRPLRRSRRTCTTWDQCPSSLWCRPMSLPTRERGTGRRGTGRRWVVRE